MLDFKKHLSNYILLWKMKKFGSIKQHIKRSIIGHTLALDRPRGSRVDAPQLASYAHMKQP